MKNSTTPSPFTPNQDNLKDHDDFSELIFREQKGNIRHGARFSPEVDRAMSMAILSQRTPYDTMQDFLVTSVMRHLGEARLRINDPSFNNTYFQLMAIFKISQSKAEVEMIKKIATAMTEQINLLIQEGDLEELKKYIHQTKTMIDGMSQRAKKALEPIISRYLTDDGQPPPLIEVTPEKFDWRKGL